MLKTFWGLVVMAVVAFVTALAVPSEYKWTIDPAIALVAIACLGLFFAEIRERKEKASLLVKDVKHPIKTNGHPIDWPSCLPDVLDATAKAKSGRAEKKRKANEERKAMTEVCSSHFDYAIRTLRDKLKAMAMESGDVFESNYSGIPPVISETRNTVTMRGNKNWNFDVLLWIAGPAAILNIVYVGTGKQFNQLALMYIRAANTIRCEVQNYTEDVVWESSVADGDSMPLINEMLSRMYSVQIIHINQLNEAKRSPKTK